MVNNRSNQIKSLGADKVFDIIVYVVATLSFLIILLPLIIVQRRPRCSDGKSFPLAEGCDAGCLPDGLRL